MVRVTMPAAVRFGTSVGGSRRYLTAVMLNTKRPQHQVLQRTTQQHNDNPSRIPHRPDQDQRNDSGCPSVDLALCLGTRWLHERVIRSRHDGFVVTQQSGSCGLLTLNTMLVITRDACRSKVVSVVLVGKMEKCVNRGFVVVCCGVIGMWKEWAGFCRLSITYRHHFNTAIIL